MQTVKREVEFTGYLMLRHRKCGHTMRLNVGENYFSTRESCLITGKGAPVVACSGCGAPLWQNAGRPVYGSFVEEKVCDGRCMGAIGPNCECSCGGKNHGANHG